MRQQKVRTFRDGFETALYHASHASNSSIINVNNNNNNNNNNSSNNNNDIPETMKYWVDVQGVIVSSHGDRDPL